MLLVDRRSGSVSTGRSKRSKPIKKVSSIRQKEVPGGICALSASATPFTPTRLTLNAAHTPGTPQPQDMPTKLSESFILSRLVSPPA